VSDPTLFQQITSADGKTIVGAVVAAVLGWLGFSKTRRATAQDAADTAAAVAEESVYALLKEQIAKLSERLDKEAAETQALRQEVMSLRFKQQQLIALMEQAGLTVPAAFR
jgi:ribosomal protein S11